MVSASTRSALSRLFAQLDWAALGDVYCDEGGEAFWDEHRGPALELGCEWADALAPRLSRSGRSLYVGAGVAELPAMLFEALELGRRVVAANRRRRECELLTTALQRACIEVPGLTIRSDDARAQFGEGPFDHLALVSVLSDPETWPTLAGVTYGRLPPVLLDVDTFVRERDEVTALVDALGASLARPAILTTTVEETPWLLAWADRVGATIDADDEVIATAIVGDPIGFLTVR